MQSTVGRGRRVSVADVRKSYLTHRRDEQKYESLSLAVLRAKRRGV